MGVYHQMGHQSNNLVIEPQLAKYCGAILSPVNDDLETIKKTIVQMRRRNGFEIVFDPQLYYPRTTKENLKTWTYFPNDYSTLDFSSLTGWSNLVNSLAHTVKELKVEAVCSPTTVAKVYNLSYYDLINEVTERLIQEIGSEQIDVLQTVLVDYSFISDYRNLMNIATTIASSKAKRLYLIFTGNNPSKPRREITDTEPLKAAMKLINVLEANNKRVLVGFCSSDIVLWKTAGATSCATGKFWNLRRFYPDRWGEDGDDTVKGGSAPAYFFEEALLAFLRDLDVKSTNFLRSDASFRNPYWREIEEHINEGTPWLALGWRQFLYWFADVEERLENGLISGRELLDEADKYWGEVEDEEIIMEERKNNGDWVRAWLRALITYTKPW